ncbi:MAG TPA: histidine kinase [Kofleriaceae bacterium]|nr:histidine kinase [Kofleriaceae bacterium]
MRDTLARGSGRGALLQGAVAALQAAGSTGNLDLREDDRVPSRRFAVITIVAWSVIALVSAAEMYAYALRSPQPITMWHALAIHAPSWAVFALATRPVVVLSRRFALDWPLRARAIAAHVAACAATSLAFATAYTGAVHAFPREPPPPLTPREIWDHVVSWAPFLLMAYASLVGIGHALAYADRVRREQVEKAALATQLAEAQLGALRMQLQPHFLFNALNSIAMLIRDGDPARAVDMIALLGDLLRALLRTSSDIEAPFASELALLHGYLDIEQIRFGDRLRVAWHVDERTAQALVPPLILQPLVENALRHGLWPTNDGGELAITAWCDGATLELEVRDQGVGLAADFDLARTTGVGLANVRARLERMYGDAAALDIAAAGARGVRVRLRLPFRLEPGARDA